ncbi:SDR family oxidoreductase [Sporichthya sp.]|uniref:SDR family oxidoreductase n=1 Tax=Sporichthya sp. TaxID=65475 RepID=UPI001822D284|nr:SDR family oxidoreductase [Sporichthya sp.]MBA3743889.1 SDR family oxidoreductase [Sporichthya sp.]
MRVLVTGAGSGIGRSLVEQLLTAGHTVVGVDRDTAGVPAGCVALHCDLSDPAQIDALADAAGALDAVANVAGVPGTAPPELVLRVNYLGARRLTEALLPRLAPGSAVVNVASLAGRRPVVDDATAWRLQSAGDEEILGFAKAEGLDGSNAYDLSKKLLVAWTVAIAAGHLSRGVRACALSPGPIETPIIDDFRVSMGAGVDAAAGAIGRLGSAAEVAAIAAFLLSPAASWVNGIDVVADGGLLALRAVAAASTTL